MTRHCVEQALAEPDAGNPPVFTGLTRDFTFTVGVGRVNRWCANGMRGLPTDDAYAKPAPSRGEPR